MAFIDDETGIATAQPVELFRLTGNYNTYRLTSNPIDVTNAEGTWSAIPIKREAAKMGTHEDTISLNLSLPMDHPMVQEYALQTAPPDLQLEFLRAHASNLEDTELIWTGNVLSFSIEGRTAKLSVPSIFNYLLDGICPPQRYQGPCNRVLYDDYCKLNATKYSQATVINSIDGRTIGVGGLIAFLDDAAIGGTLTHDGFDYEVVANTTTTFTVGIVPGTNPQNGDIFEVEYDGVILRTTISNISGSVFTTASATNITADSAIGGELRVGDESRMIVSHSGSTFQIASDFSGVSVSDEALIFQGCDRSEETCSNKFSNHRNFFGFPFIPDGNPFTRRI